MSLCLCGAQTRQTNQSMPPSSDIWYRFLQRRYEICSVLFHFLLLTSSSFIVARSHFRCGYVRENEPIFEYFVCSQLPLEFALISALPVELLAITAPFSLYLSLPLRQLMSINDLKLIISTDDIFYTQQYLLTKQTICTPCTPSTLLSSTNSLSASTDPQ